MIRFFIDVLDGNRHILTGEDAHHAIKSLRVKVGEKITLCDKNSVEHICVVDEILNNNLYLSVTKTQTCISETDIQVTLYQALPKNDKMDLIVQKSVELGVFKIVPVITSRCISKPKVESLIKKVERWQKISKEAAKQSRRGIIPEILAPIDFDKAVLNIKNYDKALIFYENGGGSIKNCLNVSTKKIAIFIGPEGGFEKEEINLSKSYGAEISTLGPRILRTETASLASLAIIMNIFAQ